MNERAIRRLRRKFIAAATLSFALVMILLGGCIYAANLIITRGDIRKTLDYLARNDGLLAMEEQGEDAPGQGNDRTEERNVPELLESAFGVGRMYASAEFWYATRYFAVIFDEDGTASEIRTSHIASLTAQEAEEYARLLLDRWRSFGQYGDYYYERQPREDGGTIVVVLDCTSQNTLTRRLLHTALLLIGFGMAVSFFVIRAVSGRMVQTEIRNAELQKQFITDASHELKTPLAVIRANTEILEMQREENEWTRSTMRQVERLEGLIRNLVQITRSEEEQEERTDLDLSVVVTAAVREFEAVAAQDGKHLTSAIPEGIRMNARESQMRQIVSLLVDNAIKYCDEGGEITVQLSKRGKSVRLVVSNPYADGDHIDYSRFFERFYRADEARDTAKGGYGIGLSIAQRIAESYKGSITASWSGGRIFFSCAMQ